MAIISKIKLPSTNQPYDIVDRTSCHFQGMKQNIDEIHALTTAAMGDIYGTQLSKQALICTKKITASDPSAWMTLGQSIYSSAVQGGYTGTEQDFYADLAAIEGLKKWLITY